MYPDNIFEITKDANITILKNDVVVKINHLLKLKSKSTWGILFFLFAGFVFIILPFIKTSDAASKIIGIAIGILLITLSIFTLIRQFSDGIIIKENNITFRLNLKKTSLTIHKNMKVTMKSDVVKINSTRTIGSDFIYVTHFIHDEGNSYPIFKFQMNNKNADRAIFLGNEISKIVMNKIQAGK